MKDIYKKFKDARLKKTPVVIALAVALVVPSAMQVFANEAVDTAEPIVIANVDENGELQNETPETTETPVEETPVNPEDETETEIVEVPEQTEEELPVDDSTDEVPAPVDPAADVARFMDFANAEHPGVAVESYAFVYKRGVKAFKVTYADGYTVFIATGDFSTLKVVDNHRRVKKCQKRVMSHRKYFHWWKKFNSYNEFWRHYQQNPADATDGIDPEAPAEEEDAEVQAATTSDNKQDKKSKKSNKKSWNNQSRREGRFDRRHR